MNNYNKKIILFGSIGAVGAFLTIIADIVYNMFNGKELGGSLYICFLALFSFPLWWGGIYVIYLGLKPAGKIWSLVPCLVFAFYTSTINVFYHSCYPFWAAIRHCKASTSGTTLVFLNNMESSIREYTTIINKIDNVMQLTICLWIAIAILFRKTYLPKWIVLLIPICPLILSLIINQFCNGFFNIVEPYLACLPMFLLFIVITKILSKKFDTEVNFKEYRSF